MGQQAFSTALTGLSAASTLNTKSAEIPLNPLTQVGGFAIWSAGCSAGQVVFEVAPTAAYGGTWFTIATMDFQDNGTEPFTYPGPFGFGRWRVSTAVVGGTVSSQTLGLAG